jgi:hypothetical protein
MKLLDGKESLSNVFFFFFFLPLVSYFTWLGFESCQYEILILRHSVGELDWPLEKTFEALLFSSDIIKR